MIQLELFPPSSTPVSSKVQTFADIIELISQVGSLSTIQKRDFTHALKRVAEGLATPCDQIQAAPASLGPRLKMLSAKSMGIQQKTLANLLCNVRKALTLFSRGSAKAATRREWSTSWQALWNLVSAMKSRTIHCALSGPIGYFNRCGFEPSEIAIEHFQAWKATIAESLTHKHPDHAYRKAVRAWNQAAGSIENWPKTRLHLPKDPRWITLPLDHFPASFRNDLARYLDRLKHPNRLETKTPYMGFAPTTIAQYRALLLRFASILVHAGVNPAKIENLAALVDPGAVKIGLEWMLARTGDALTNQISDMAGLIKRIAMNYVNVSDADQKELDKFSRNLAIPQRRALTDKNELRILPFREKDLLLQLYRLPDLLFARSMEKPGSLKSATLREDAIAIALLLRVPLRRKNLLSIHLENNIRVDAKGLRIVFSSAETKGRMPIDVKMPEHVVDMVQLHLKIRSPVLCSKKCPWLFPNRHGSEPPLLCYIADRIKRRILSEIGHPINIHLFRHLAAITYLEENPGDYEVVRQFLGHKSRSQTIDFYAGSDSNGAVQLLSEVIEASGLRQ